MDPECLGEDFQRVICCWIQKCCISNALHGTENDFAWQGAEDDNDDSDYEEDNGEEQSENENSE
jgi:hypothetical protein